MSTLPHLRKIGVLALAIVSTPLLAQTPVRLTTGSGPGSRFPIVALDADVVAYLAIVNGSREMFTVATDGSPPVQRTTGADVRVGHGALDIRSPLSISDDGRWIAYWNAQGVHVLDTRLGADVVATTAALLPFPQLDADGSRLVYQAPVNGSLEVFIVDRAGARPPRQLTSDSGAGRRLPHLRAAKVVFQKLVGLHMELFVIDLQAGTTTGPLTTNSGGGNRHARLTPAADAVVYEAVGADFLQPMRLSLAGGSPVLVAPGSSGARLPAGDGDQQVVLQTTATAPEVWLADPAMTQHTAASRGGHRLPAIDRHGQVLVWQLEHLARNEVFALRRCWPAEVYNYGSAGQPSAGALVPFVATWRCQQSEGLHTQLPVGTLGVHILGTPQSLPLAPLGAPGNWLLVTFGAWQGLLVDAQGDLTFTYPLHPVLLQQRTFTQFAVLDTTANPLGVVTSAAFSTTLP
ncbi:MAG TPA: hypothetical protein VFD82_01135 [Planctomycetota bacterium]|nr:hypothetical protein [Planctomycetota bacterium]